MSFQRLVKWEQRMTGEKYSAETKEEYENKRKGCVKLLEIYRHLHQQGQVSKKMMHTMLFVNLRWSRWLTHSVFVRSARKGDWSAGAQETCVLAAKEIRRSKKSGRERITWSQWLFWDFVNMLDAEQMLIARLAPTVHVHLLKHGGIASKGHCIAFPQAVQDRNRSFRTLSQQRSLCFPYFTYHNWNT